jgi:hypothetical protein
VRPCPVFRPSPAAVWVPEHFAIFLKLSAEVTLRREFPESEHVLPTGVKTLRWLVIEGALAGSKFLAFVSPLGSESSGFAPGDLTGG